jgi:hypothetical protein
MHPNTEPSTDALETSGGADKQYKRVGGWLGLFCFQVLVLAPIKAFQPAQFLFTSVFYYRLYQPLWTETGVDVAVGTALVAFGILAGIQLVRLKPSAVRLTMIFLACNPAYGVTLVVVAPLLFEQPMRFSFIPDALLDYFLVKK